MIMQGKRGDKVMRYNEVDGKIKKTRRKDERRKWDMNDRRQNNAKAE